MMSQVVLGVAHIETEPGFAGNHIRGARPSFDGSNGSHQPQNISCGSFNGADPLSRACHCVEAEVHGGCARMIGTTSEDDVHASLAGDGLDYSQRLPKIFKYRSLL